MPVSFTTNADPSNPRYLIPAPMVQINKEYDRTGDGAIIGVRYPITLEGTLVAHMGVPDYTGSFVDGVGASLTVNKNDSLQVSKIKWMYRAIQNKQMAIRKLFSQHTEGGQLHIQALDTEGFKCNPRNISVDFSQDPGQPNIMRYVIQLEVDELGGPPASVGVVDGTATAAGATVAGLMVDPEGSDAITLDGVNNPYFKWKVTDASENWAIDEQDGKSINYKQISHTDTLDPDHKRYRHVTQKDGTSLSGFAELTVAEYEAKVLVAKGDDDAALAADKEIKRYKPIGGFRVQKVSKTYLLTHTMTATGKRVFDKAGTNDTIGSQPVTGSKTHPPNLLDDMSIQNVNNTWNPSLSDAGSVVEGTGVDNVNASADYSHEKDFVPDGEAWQQARGYVLNHLSGSDPTHRGPGYQKALTDLSIVGDSADAEHPFSPVNNPFFGNAGFVDMYGINLPRVGGAGDNKAQHKYTACDYKRVQTIDKTAGTFSVTETWVLVDNDSLLAEKTLYDADEWDIGLTTETIEFSIDEADGDGFKEVSVAGTITGMSEAEDEYLPTKTAETDAYWNQDKFGKVVGGGFFGHTAATHAGPETSHDDTATAAAESAATGFEIGRTTKYEEALRRFHWLLPKLHEICQTATGEQLNAVRRSYSITKNPTEGSVSYNVKFDSRNNNTISCVKDETITVNDTHPSHVFAETAVLGRRMGPVLQDINTQSSWKRNLNVELSVSGVLDGRDWQEAMRNKPSMIVNRCFHPDYTDAASCQTAGFTYVEPSAQQCSTGNDLRDIIDAVSPRGKEGVTGWFVSAGPNESWDAINGNYTFSLEWTFEKEEGPVPYNVGIDSYKKAISKSYLGTKMFQYPRMVEQKDPTAHETQEQILHNGDAEHHAAF